MRFNKKGDLAISTNAIVILIIAVIMLGLIIGFVTRGFSSVEEKFFGQIDQMPDPVAPSGSKPITFSEVMIASQGEQFGTKVSIYNPTAQPVADVVPTITCLNTGVFEANSIKANKQTIAANGYKTFTVIGKIADGAPGGKQLCQVASTQLPQAGQADLIIEVRE